MSHVENDEYIVKIFHHLDRDPMKDYIVFDDILRLFNSENDIVHAKRLVENAGYRIHDRYSLESFRNIINYEKDRYNGDFKKILQMILERLKLNIIPLNEKRDDTIVITTWYSTPDSFDNSDIHIYPVAKSLEKILVSSNNPFIKIINNQIGKIIKPSNIQILFPMSHSSTFNPTSSHFHLSKEKIFFPVYDNQFDIDNLRRIDILTNRNPKYKKVYEKYNLKCQYKPPENLKIYCSSDLRIIGVHITPDERGIRTICLIN